MAAGLYRVGRGTQDGVHLMSTVNPGPQLVCPGCGSPHVEFERGLLFCGTCAATVEAWGQEPGDD